VSDLQQLVATTCAEFEQIHRSSFLEDPACNPNLIVEIVEPAMVDDTPTMILIAPWTLSGIMFPPLGKTLPELVVGQRRFPVFENTLDGIGTYSSVNLVPDVGGFADREAAQHAAAALAAPFREAVARALQGLSVADPGRRDLFKRLAGSD
jgi:hypothetical protein